MPLSDGNIIESLPLLGWRGLAAPPYDIVSCEWDNGLAPRRVPYVNGEVHDAVGRGSFPLGARLYFINTLNAAPPDGVERYFPDYWNVWQQQLLDGDPGDLDHPVLGKLRARVKGGKFEVRASVRSGVIVDVTWLETVENPADLNLNGYQNTTLPTAALAAQADAMIAPWGIGFAPGRPLTSLSAQYGITFGPDDTTATIGAIFDAIRGPVFTGGLRALSLLSALMGDVGAMIDALSARNDVRSYAAADAMIAFFLACENMRSGVVRSARRTGVFVAPTRLSLDAVAAKVGNSVTELMGLNLKLLVRPTIARGTPVTYYKAS